MPESRQLLLLMTACAALILLGASCFGRKTEFVEAPKSEPVHVEPNLEGARASTGGQEATITPQLDTEKLAAALPDPETLGTSVTAGEVVERLNPVPLPDGTRTEYVSVEREYVLKKDGGDVILRATLSDTRGIPVVSAFTRSFSEFRTDEGYRRPADVRGTEAWIQYTYDPAGVRSGFGSLTMLYRERFLIQIDGSMGLSESDLIAFAEMFDLERLD
jgi:hypothetical protein